MAANGASDVPLRVLVIDDNADYAESVRMVFRVHVPQASVECCLTAKEGLARLALGPPVDCILLDLVLPCGKGPELLDRVLCNVPRIPIVVISGYLQADPELDELLIRSGAQDVLPKASTDAETLVRTVLHAVTRHRVRVQAAEAKVQQAAAVKQTVEQLAALSDSQMGKAKVRVGA